MIDYSYENRAVEINEGYSKHCTSPIKFATVKPEPTEQLFKWAKVVQ